MNSSAERTIRTIDIALNAGLWPLVHENLRTLVANQGTQPDVATFLQKTFDRIEAEDAAQRPMRSISDERTFEFHERLENGSLSGNRYAPKNNVEKAYQSAADGLEVLADHHKRDKAFVPVFDRLIDILADRHLIIAQEAAMSVKHTASPKWLGNVGIEEGMALTGFYKLKQPLKRAAMQALLRIADKAMTKGRFDIADQATYGAEAQGARELEDISVIARQKRELIQNTRPKQLDLGVFPA